MRFLSPEVQLDIFKWLTFKQLISIQQTNNFYKIFLNKYEDKLARKKFDKLEILYGNEGSSSYYEFFEPDPKLYDFQISEQLEKKWKCGIENSIPMFLSDFDTNMNIVVCELEQYSYHEESYYSQLPNLPKNIEDMKIARCILEQLFKCFFEFVQLDKVIFNPQMIKLLFDENKPNMPLQLHSQSAHLFILNKSDDCLLEFILNHLIFKEFTVDFWKFNRRMQNINILFGILTKGEDKFGVVSCRHVQSEFCNDIIKEPTTTTELTTTEEPTTTTTEEQTTTPLPTCPYPIVIPYPKIPATIDLLKLGFGEGFAPPKRIRFVGSPTNTTDRFTINLYSDGVPDKTATTLFHFNPRFNDKQVIRNTWSPITGWEEEEHYGGFPFKIGEPFVLEFIAAPENTIIVNVDSQPFVNFSRDDLSKLSTLGVSSAIELSSVVLCHDKPITSTIEPTTTTEEQATTTEEPTTIEEPTTTTEEPTTTTEEPTTTTSKPTTTILPTTTTTKPPQYCPGQIVLNNLKIPATLDFVKLGFGTGFHFFSPKKRIIIFGTPLAQPTAFNINIGEPGKLLVTANVLFHLSPDFLKNKVIRNTWIVGKGWGKEENHGGFPFKVEEPFVLELYEGADYFDIKVNNKPFVSFERYNMDKVSQMEIEKWNPSELCYSMSFT
uniref:Galectin domain-containing protein n=1 Tax=Meloidogyne incognita TaxID=6306 RepID=A0A914N7R9_MELIC